MNQTDVLVQNAEREVARIHESLTCRARELADRMARLAVRLERDGVNASINELGEVQCLGPEIDRECALLRAALTHATALRLAVQVAEQPR